MRKLIAFSLILAAPLAIASCAGGAKSATDELVAANCCVTITSDMREQIAAAGADPAEAERLSRKPIYTMSEEEVDTYLRVTHILYPDLPTRVEQIGKQNIGQPYEIFLLGEAPFENYDPQPLYCLEKSDCVVFSEHTYAMALAHDWPSFFKTLQRIRYKNGEISVITRNHYTEVDWDVNNSWLIHDITQELAGDAMKSYTIPIDRAGFFAKRYSLELEIPKQKHEITFIPVDIMPQVEPKLRDGDFVNIVREKNGGYWVGHTGLVSMGDDGVAYFLHSTPPAVKIQTFQEYIAQHRERETANSEAAHIAGFKFLRLHDDPIENLYAIDGPNAPVITPPTHTGIKRIAKSDDAKK